LTIRPIGKHMSGLMICLSEFSSPSVLLGGLVIKFTVNATAVTRERPFD